MQQVGEIRLRCLAEDVAAAPNLNPSPRQRHREGFKFKPAVDFSKYHIYAVPYEGEIISHRQSLQLTFS